MLGHRFRGGQCNLQPCILRQYVYNAGAVSIALLCTSIDFLSNRYPNLPRVMSSKSNFAS